MTRWPATGLGTWWDAWPTGTSSCEVVGPHGPGGPAVRRGRRDRACWCVGDHAGVARHACAVAAVPFTSRLGLHQLRYLVVGRIEVPGPVIDDRAFAAGSPTKGCRRDLLLLSNGTGLWLLHECRRTWEFTDRDGSSPIGEPGRVGTPLGLTG